MQLYEDPTELTAQMSALLAGEAAPSSAALLQLALLCLQTGHPDQATRLRRSGQLSAEHLAELQSLESCDPLSLYTSWKAAATSGWQTALSPDVLLRLGLLLSSPEDDAITRLRSDLQEVFGEAMAQADQPLALQLWDQLCRRCPDWSWARLLACDLALQAEQLELCHHHIEAAPETERRSSSCRRRWDAAIEQARAEGQFKWASALVNRGIDLPPPSQSSDAPGTEPPPPNSRG